MEKKRDLSQIKKMWSKNVSAIAYLWRIDILSCIIFHCDSVVWGERLVPEKLATLMSDVIVHSVDFIGAVFIYALGNLDISIGKQIGLYATIMVVTGNMWGTLVPGVAICIVLSVFVAIVNESVGSIAEHHSDYSVGCCDGGVIRNVSRYVLSSYGNSGVLLCKRSITAYLNPRC